MMRYRWVHCPCRGCPDRHEKCHASCEKYAEYKKQFNAEKERIFQEDSIDKVVKHMNVESARMSRKTPEPLKHGRKKR